MDQLMENRLVFVTLTDCLPSAIPYPILVLNTGKLPNAGIDALLN